MLTFPGSILGDGNPSQTAKVEDDTQKVGDLNKSLTILAVIFPHIQTEVLREALQAFSGDSRLHIAVDQLLKNQDKWVRGRWRTRNERYSDPIGTSLDIASGSASINAEDAFRRASYKWAVYATLCQEFKSVSKSAVRAVLAEENHSYTRSRGTLQGLAAKSWRNAIASLWIRWRKTSEERKQHFMVICNTKDGGSPHRLPTLKETGDPELDKELQKTILEPLLASLRSEQELKDWDLANDLNDKEARAAKALYECQCCFSDSPFEQITICTTSAHFVCQGCVGRAVTESLFGQGWARNVDHVNGLLKCPSLSSGDGCNGYIQQDIVQRAIQQAKGGGKTWEQWNARLTEDCLSESQLSLVKCPFCAYAEVDELYTPASQITYHPNLARPKTALLLFIITLNFLPLLALYFVLCHLITTHILPLPPLKPILSKSLSRLVRRHHRPGRFHCRSPSCAQWSCLTCAQPWRDPHTCFESAAVSLRTAIESARTAALKRTCPRCGLAFIKDSGCNKLTCVCGYSMCYVCRQGLGRGTSTEGGRGGGGGDDGAGQGYRHFCQHFRPMGGKCGECDRCDLYKNVDDDDMVLQAGIRAEKEWREREGMVGVQVQGISGSSKPISAPTFMTRVDSRGDVQGQGQDGRWSLQALSDWWVSVMITC